MLTSTLPDLVLVDLWYSCSLIRVLHDLLVWLELPVYTNHCIPVVDRSATLLVHSSVLAAHVDWRRTEVTLTKVCCWSRILLDDSKLRTGLGLQGMVSLATDSQELAVSLGRCGIVVRVLYVSEVVVGSIRSPPMWSQALL